MIDVRKRIKGLLDEYGHDIIYIRRDTRFRCECYVERSGESSPECPLCYGTGYVVEIQKKRARRQVSTVPETLVGVNQTHKAGRFTPMTYTYYLEHFDEPKEEDLILEVIWDVSGVPRFIKEKLIISAAPPQFGYKGRVEFYQVYARYDQKGVHDDTALTER